MSEKFGRIIGLILDGFTVAEITSLVSCSNRDVSAARKLIAAESISKESFRSLTSDDIAALRPDKRKAVSQKYDQPDFAAVIKALRKYPHHTVGLAWENYCAAAPAQEGLAKYSYSAFCSQFARFAGKSSISAVLSHKPGYAVHVDWAGDHLYLVDAITGDKTAVHLFVATLPYSGLMHMSAWLDEKMDAWLGGHIAAFEYFQAVPKLVISDNARTATTPRCDGKHIVRTVTDRYAKLCKHYGLAVFPTDVYSPRQKAAVENSVGVSYRRVLGYLEQEVFTTLDQLREAVAEHVDALNKDFTSHAGTTRHEIFVEDELPVMAPLPVEAYTAVEYLKRTVQRNICVQVDRHFYSVPYRLVGKEVTVKLTAKQVTVIDNNTIVATHQRFYSRRRRHSIDDGHRPPAHANVKNLWTAEYFYSWARQKYGHNLEEVLRLWFARCADEIEGLFDARNILTLAKNNADVIDEVAATVIVQALFPSYTTLRDLCRARKAAGKAQDTSSAAIPETPSISAPPPLPEDLSVRGSDYYNQKGW